MLTIMPHFGISFQSFATIFFFLGISHTADLTIRTSHANDANDAIFHRTQLSFLPFFLHLETHTLSMCEYEWNVWKWRQGYSMFLPACFSIASKFKINSLSCGAANTWSPLSETGLMFAWFGGLHKHLDSATWVVSSFVCTGVWNSNKLFSIVWVESCCRRSVSGQCVARLLFRVLLIVEQKPHHKCHKGTTKHHSKLACFVENTFLLTHWV